MADLIICRNPLCPQLDREVSKLRTGVRIDTVLRNKAMIAGRRDKLRRLRRFVVQVNGDYLLQDSWCRRVHSDDLVVIALLPAGGGGGGSNPMQIVLMIAIVVASVYTGGAVGAAYGAAAGAAAQAGVMIAGTLLMNAVIPPPSASASSMMNREAASPSYSIGAQGNSARLMEAIPVLYGQFRVFPDFAAQPYTENTGNQQYLFQLFCISQGEIDIEEIRIEDTSIDNFAEVEYEVIQPGESVTLFPDNVVTSSAVQGLELVGFNERPANAPDDWSNVQGPFVANPSGTEANAIAIDIVLAQGLFYTNDNGSLGVATITWSVAAQRINEDGLPIGEPVRIATEALTLATAQPQVLTYRYPMASGRYQISVVRTNEKDTSSRVSNTLSWTGLRTYLPSKANYGNVTMLATIIRGTNNLNQQTARRINVIATRKLPTWDPVNGWSVGTIATRSPAWAFADIARDTDYGRGLPDNRLNLFELHRLAAVWASRGDTYDGVFDTTSPIWQALTTVARVGRSMPMYYAGVIDIIRNEPRSIATAMFSPHNIVKDSLSISYQFPEYDSPDHVVVEYISDATWQPDQVVCVLPGGTTNRPAKVQLIGCTNRDQAWREGMSMAAANRDQRKFITISSELEGNIPRYGDLVQISHDVPAWGLSGLILGCDHQTKIYKTSEPLKWFEGQTHYVAFRRRDGSADGPHIAIKGPDLNSFIVDDLDEDIYISDGIDEEYTHYQFGPAERRGLAAQVLYAMPQQNGQVTLNFVNYADSVHIAENGGVVPLPSGGSQLPGQENAPVVSGLAVYATAITGQQIVSVTPTSGAQSYEFQASNDLGVSWMALGVAGQPSLTINLPAGPWWLRARGIGVLAGPWTTLKTAITATMLPPPKLALLTATSLTQGIQLNWVFPATAIGVKAVQVNYGQTPVLGDSLLLGNFVFPQTSHQLMGLAYGVSLFFWARIIDLADQPGPWFPGEGAGINGQSESDATDILEALAGKLKKEQLAQELLAPIELIENAEDILNALPDAATINQVLSRQNGLNSDQDALAATQLIALANADASDARIRTVLEAAFNDNLRALIEDESHVRAEADGTLAEHIETVQATANNTSAQVQTTAQALAETNGNLASMFSIKMQVHGPTGVTYSAGIGLGIDNSSGVFQSKFLVQADQFAFINVNNGVLTTPFQIVNGVTVMKSALIGDATIGTAKLTDWLESAAVNPNGVPILRLNFKTGEIQLNGSTSGGSRMTLTNSLVQVFDNAGTLRVRMGIW